MALYNPDNFSEDITNILKVDRSEADDLKDILLKVKVDNNMTWEFFNEKMKTLLTNFMTNLKPGFGLPAPDPDMRMKSVPEYDQAKTFDEICAYLDSVKGNHIEDNLKRHILKSQLEEEKHNYFARIFDLWQDMTPKLRKAFLCCYAEVLLTQQITRLMLNYIISTFAKLYKKGLDISLYNQLSGGEVKYDTIEERGSFLHLIYALTFVDADDDKAVSFKRSKEVLLSVLSKDDYNPRSFLEVTYYYAIVNLLDFPDFEKMLRDTAKLVIINLFGDDKSDAAETFSSEATLSKIESFLDFNPDSVRQCLEYFKRSDPDLDIEKAVSVAESKMRDMKVNYFNGNVYDRETNTYNYAHDSIDPKIDVSSDQYMMPEELCRWMAEERHFYESYFDIESKTRAMSLYGDVTPDKAYRETDYAYLIVHKDLLNFRIGGYGGIGKKKWKNRVLKVRNPYINSENSKTSYDFIEIMKHITDFNSLSTYIKLLERNQDKVNSESLEQLKIRRGILVGKILSGIAKPIEQKYSTDLFDTEVLSICDYDELMSRIKMVIQIEKILEELDKVFCEISYYKGNKQKVNRVREYEKVNRVDLAKAILYELIRTPEEKYAIELAQIDETIKTYASEIVHSDSLDNLNIPGYSCIGTIDWKNDFRRIESDQQRAEQIEQFLKDKFDEIKNILKHHDTKKDCSIIIECMGCDPTALAQAVSDELKRKKAGVYDKCLNDRAKYLYIIFEEYCTKDKSLRAALFQMKFSESGDEDGDMAEHRWPYFSPLRYQDAMLYMCLNCDNPKAMFNRINSTPGYDYYQKDST